MGAVKRQIFNSVLMNVSNYNNLKTLSSLLSNYHNLARLSELGDMVAASIYIDLRRALDSDSLTELQRKSLTLRYVYGYSVAEITKVLNVKSLTSVRKHLNGGLKRIRTFLGGN